MATTFLKRRSLLLGAAATTTMGLAAPTSAQAFLSKPVRLVVPYSAGGGADTTARLMAPKLQEALGQTVVIDNKPGAGGTIRSTPCELAAFLRNEMTKWVEVVKLANVRIE